MRLYLTNPPLIRLSARTTPSPNPVYKGTTAPDRESERAHARPSFNTTIYRRPHAPQSCPLPVAASRNRLASERRRLGWAQNKGSSMSISSSFAIASAASAAAVASSSDAACLKSTVAA